MKNWILIAVLLAAACKDKPKQAPPSPRESGTASAKPTSAGSASNSGSATITTGAAASWRTPTGPADGAQQEVFWRQLELARTYTPPSDRLMRAALLARIIDETARWPKPAARQAFDPNAISDAVGRDRAALFQWVRDQTAAVPYRGSLRGPVGVVMDRCGNSLDRALLLAELLKRTGARVRLATAMLPDDKLAAVARTWSTRPRPPIPSFPNLKGLATRIAGIVGISPASLDEKLANSQEANAKLVAQARARIAEQTKAVAALVPAARASGSGDTDAFREHWWVQMQDKGDWVDLDPALPDAVIGERLVGATSTAGVADIKDDKKHLLTLRLVGEVWRGDERQEVALVEHTLAPQAFYGQQITITNVPVDMPSEDTLLASTDPLTSARAAVAAQTEWMPVIRIGNATIANLSVTDAGEVWKMTGPDANTMRLARNVAEATKKNLGKATGLFGELPSGSPTAPGAPVAKPPIAAQTGFTAEWLEIEVRAPGAPPNKTRRTIFDTAGGTIDRSVVKRVALSDAARLERGLSLVGRIEVLPMFARIPNAFVTDRTVKTLVAAKPVLVDLLRADNVDAVSRLRPRLAKLPPLPGSLYALALARFDWSPVADHIYLAHLDVLVQRHLLIATPDGGLRERSLFDIVANGVAVWPTPGRDTRATRIEQGVTDTVAETLAKLDCQTDDCVHRDNASDQLAADATGWAIVPRDDDLSRFPAESRPLVAADLAAGYAVIAPPAPRTVHGRAQITWWRVHPDTGETLGMGRYGGAVSAEVVAELTMFGISALNCYGSYRQLGTNPMPGITMANCAAAAVIGTGAGVYTAFAAEKDTEAKELGLAISVLASMLSVDIPNLMGPPHPLPPPSPLPPLSPPTPTPEPMPMPPLPP